MKRLRTAILSLLMVVAMLLVSCGENKPTTDTEAPSTQQEAQTTDTSAPETDREFIKISNNSNLLIKLADSDYRSYVNDFKSAFELKTGMTMKMVNSSVAATDFEMIVGRVSGREESVSFYEDISYAECAAEIVNGKLVVATFTENMLEEALSAVNRAIVKENGEWGIWSDFSYSKALADIPDDIPKFETKSGTMIQGVKSNDGFQVGYTGCKKAEYEAYCQKLEGAGYTLYASNTVKNNEYMTYVTEKTMAHLTWQGEISTFRVFVSPKGYLPATEAPKYTAVKTATVAQIMLTGGWGMSFVIQLEDGSFVVIDGGVNNAADKSTLMTYLKSNKPSEHSKPHVTWILTHPHSDHIELALSFLQAYSNQIQLDMISFNFPDVNSLTWSTDYTTTSEKQWAKQKIEETWKLMADKFPNTKIFIHHTGQKLLLAGAEIEFIFTQEDWWPNGCQTFNDTMSTFMVTFKNGKKFFVTGDSDQGVCNLMAKNYGDYLKCDIFQAVHHGQKGGTAALYNLLKPTYVFWPNSKKKCTTTVGDIYEAPIHHSDRSSFNPILFNDPNILGHFHGEQTTIININTMTAIDGKGNAAVSFWPLR